MTISKMAQEITQAGATILVDSMFVQVKVPVEEMYDGTLYGPDPIAYKRHDGNIMQAFEDVVIEAHARLDDIKNYASPY